MTTKSVDLGLTLDDIIHPFNHLKVFTISSIGGVYLCEANFIDFESKRCYFKAYGDSEESARFNCIARILDFYNEV